MSLLDERFRAGSTAASPSPATGHAVKGSLARILIADGHAVSRRILGSTLRRLGHACDLTEDGEQVFKHYLVFRPDVLIVDWTMPGLNGRELFWRIREAADDRYCYVIVNVAVGENEHILAGMRAGADDYLTRPLDRAELESRLIAARRVAALHAKSTAREAKLVQAENRGSDEARRDPLTGLGNGLGLQEDLAALDGRTQRYGKPYCIALCDLDRSKPYDDPAGPLECDRVLRAVAEALRGECRGADFAYRHGGDEIVVVLRDRTPQSARRALERMRQAVEALGIPHAEKVDARVITISAGVATRENTPGESCSQVLRRAGAALREARGRGNNCIVASTGSDPRPSDQDRESLAPEPRHLSPAPDRSWNRSRRPPGAADEGIKARDALISRPHHAQGVANDGGR